MEFIRAAMFSTLYILIPLLDHMRQRKTKESVKLLQKKVYMVNLLTYYFAVIICGMGAYYYREYFSSSIIIIVICSMVPIILAIILESGLNKRIMVVMFMFFLSITFMTNMFLIHEYNSAPSMYPYVLKLGFAFISMLVATFYIRYYTVDKSIRTFRLVINKTVDSETRNILMNMFITDIIMEHRKESHVVKGVLDGKYKEVRIPFDDIGHIEFVYKEE